MKSYIVYFGIGLFYLLSIIDMIFQHKINPFVIVGIVSLCAFDFYASLKQIPKQDVDVALMKKDIESVRNAIARISLAVGFKTPEK
jgi:uncharacterized membrane protein